MEDNTKEESVESASYSKSYTEIECYKYHTDPDTIVLLHNQPTNEYFKFKLHKNYLKNCPFFNTMFFKTETFKESFQKENIVQLENLDEVALKDYFLGQFIKTQTDGEKFIDFNIETCIELRRVADYFNDTAVVEEIDIFLLDYMTTFDKTAKPDKEVSSNIENPMPYLSNLENPRKKAKLTVVQTSKANAAGSTTQVCMILPLLSVESKILQKAVSTFIAKNSKNPETQKAVIDLPPELFEKVLAYFKLKLAIPEINLQALVFRYLGTYLKKIINSDGQISTIIGISLIKKAFESCKVNSEIQRRLLMKFNNFFEKFSLHKDLVDLMNHAQNCARMNWFVMKSDLLKLDNITNSVELLTRDRARVTIQTSSKMSLDCPNTYFEMRILEGSKHNNVAFSIGCITKKFNHRNRQRDRFAEQEEEVVGWRDSYGYHSDNGGIYEGQSTANKICKVYQKGDVVGCGRVKDFVFFTKNGKLVNKCKLKNTKDNVYPAITFDQCKRRQPGEKHAKIYLLGPNEYIFAIDKIRKRCAGYSGYKYDDIFQKYVKNENAFDYSLDDGETDNIEATAGSTDSLLKVTDMFVLNQTSDQILNNENDSEFVEDQLG